MSFTLKVLGGASLEGPEGPVHGRAAHKRRIALLTVLAAARGRTVARERILALLWPDVATQAARHTLSESLSVLRRELGNDVFTAVGDELGLNPEVVTSDLEAFHAALDADAPERAVSLYHGALLDGFTVADAPEFERWAEEERDRVARAFARAVERLAVDAEAAGDAHAAAEWWRRLATHDPLSSRVALRLMQALDTAGEREAALRHASVHAALLRAELEMEPAAEVTAFAEGLRTRAAAPPPPPTPSAEPRPAPPGPAADVAPRPAAGAAPGPLREERTSTSPRPETRRRAVILCAGVVTSGGRGARAGGRTGRFRREARRQIRRAGGSLVDFLGATVLAEFADAPAAAGAALRLVGRFGRASRAAGDAAAAHAALHLGEVATAPDGGYYGEAVSAATRLQEEAPPGAVLVTHDVRAALRGAPGLRLRPIGTRTLPGAGAPSGVYEVRLPRGRRPAPPAAPAPERLPAPRAPRPGGWPRRAAVLGLAAVALATGLGVARQGAATAESPTLDPNRIAVIPFELGTGDTAVRHLAAGLTDQVLLQLSGVEPLQVVSRAGVERAWRADVPTDSLARALRAGTLLEARPQVASDSVRVVMHLVDGATGRVVASGSVQQPLGRPLAMETEVGREIARLIRIRLGDAVALHAVRLATRDDEARTAYLRGRQAERDAQVFFRAPDAHDARSGFRALARADTLFARAAAHDPAWNEPVAARGRVALVRADRGGEGGDTTHGARAAHLAQAIAFAERVLARAPASAEALEIRGTARFRQAQTAGTGSEAVRLGDAAEDDLRRAGTAGALSVLSQLLRSVGHYAEALAEARRAHALDAYLMTEADLLDREIRTLLLQERFERSWTLCRAARAEYPDDLRFLQCELNLLARDGGAPADTALARGVMAKLEEMEPRRQAGVAGRSYSPVYNRLMLAALLVRAGARDSARAELARARLATAGDPSAGWSMLYDDAWISHRLGDTAHARASLARYVRARPFHLRHVQRDPVFRGWADGVVRGVTGR